jgi:hypothetical protein
MTGQDPGARDLLRLRSEAIATVSALNARAHKLIQAIAGNEMEILRLELEIARKGESFDLPRDLQDAMRKAEALMADQDDCADEIANAEARVAEIDALITAARGSGR